MRLPKFLRRKKIGLAIAGGGCKAFFGLGAGEVLMNAGLPIKAITATSAGSAMALTLVSRVSEQVMHHFCSMVYQNESNFHMRKLLKLEKPFPHERIYRNTIASNLDMEKLFRTDIQLGFNALRLPSEYHPIEKRAAFVKLMARVYTAYARERNLADRAVYKNLMSPIVADAGLTEVIFRNEDMTTSQRVEDIILATSSAPPIVNVQIMSDGHYYLDGGIWDNLPIDHLPEDVDLVVAVHYQPLTRFLYEQRRPENRNNIIYIAPPASLPISTWDYTNPFGVRAAYEMGKNAALRSLKQIKAAL